jgi:hypothetical protein
MHDRDQGLRQSQYDAIDRPITNLLCAEENGLSHTFRICQTGFFSFTYCQKQCMNAGLPIVKGLAGIALICALIISDRSVIAADEISQAIRAQECIHAVPTGSIANFVSEEWLSLNQRWQASRIRGNNQIEPQLLFFDLKDKVLSKFLEKQNTIYRLPESSEPPGMKRSFLRDLCEQLTDGSSEFSFFRLRNVEQTRRTVQEGDRSFIEIALKFSDAGDLDGFPVGAMTVHIDPKTNLPGSVSWKDKKGNEQKISIDYPTPAPASIFDLGVPRTAIVIDRVPTDEVQTILTGFKAGRFAFDDYCAYVGEQQAWGHNKLSETQLYRIWRKGLNWRVERLVPIGEKTKQSAKNRNVKTNLPDDVNAEWFKVHQTEFRGVPEGMGNGKINWWIQLSDDWMPGTPINPKDVTREKVRPPVDSPYPVAGQKMLPEHAGHPAWEIYPPGPDCKLVLDATPGDGPENTLLLICRNTNKDWPTISYHCRFWLDPNADYLARKSELTVHDNKDLSKIAFFHVQEIEASQTSPQGIAYPTKVREFTVDEKDQRTSEKLYSYYVDFDAEIPDNLFEPPK